LRLRRTNRINKAKPMTHSHPQRPSIVSARRALRRGALAAASGALLLAATSRGEAHHSFAMYDQSTTRTLTGKLTRFIPGANHAQLVFELLDAEGEVVADASGKPVLWGIEMGRAAEIARDGVSVDGFPLGTVLTVTLYPLRDGRNFGAQARGTPVIKCGMELPAGGCNADTGEAFLTGDAQ
jgi:hypothetical protein